MKSRYSKCKCGETAFDGKFENVLENDKVVIRLQYRCRNCLRLLKTKLNESNKPIFNIYTMKECRE
jgi:hypothetical protein